MATAPWLVLLITVIGIPLLGALLYFFVRRLRVAKRLGIWLSASNPPWWVQNIFAALLVGGIVAVVSILWQKSISDDQARQATRIEDLRAEQATRLENLRFVRQLSSEPGIVARPFSGLDLQGQILTRLDLTGADLDHANLQHADLMRVDLSPAPPTHTGTPSRHSDLSYSNLTGADLSYANLTEADLTDATLTGAYLTGATLTGDHLTDANLGGATLTIANLTRAALAGANLTGAMLTGANLAGADLTDANLTDANLSDVNLSGANLTGVHCDENTKWSDGFKPPPCG